MYKQIKFIISLVAMVLFLSCNDESVSKNVDIDGNYVGIFTVEYTNGTEFSNQVTVNLSDDGSYVSSGNGNQGDFYPAGGSGTFELNDNTLNFADSNIWLADFDWHLILSGEYEYLIEDNKLILHKNLLQFGLYKYELRRK